MADAKKTACENVRRAQSNYKRKTEEAREERRDTFKQAQEEGLSLREIAAEVDLHWTRVGEILKGK